MARNCNSAGVRARGGRDCRCHGSFPRAAAHGTEKPLTLNTLASHIKRTIYPTVSLLPRRPPSQTAADPPSFPCRASTATDLGQSHTRYRWRKESAGKTAFTDARALVLTGCCTGKLALRYSQSHSLLGPRARASKQPLVRCSVRHTRRQRDVAADTIGGREISRGLIDTTCAQVAVIPASNAKVVAGKGEPPTRVIKNSWETTVATAMEHYETPTHCISVTTTIVRHAMTGEAPGD